ncbi:MAG TPA: helix-turn-helix domain-containing protein [Rhodospirillales bacterium]|nr:helix-turn-helix domain-containing protein [Rhodospirillales bacterium]
MASPEQAETDEQKRATSVGALLKASRLRIGNDLRHIANILKIRYVYLEAIEDGRFEDLPGHTYSMGFVRAYAEHLGLDSDEVIRRFKNQDGGDYPEPSLDFPEPIPEMGIPGGAIIFIGFLVAAVAYGAWYVNTSKEGIIADLIAPVPKRMADQPASSGKPKEPAPVVEAKMEPKPEKPVETPTETVTAPTQVPATERAGVTTTVTAIVTTAETPAPPASTPTPEPDAPVETVATPEPAPTPAAPVDVPSAPSVVPMDIIPPAAPAQASTAAPVQSASQLTPAAQISALPATAPKAEKTTAPSGAQNQIVVRAKMNSWIQVRDDTVNVLLVTRLLRAGDSYAVPNRSGLKLSTGNAGALEILVDGIPVPSIGGEGTVRRNVVLDADKLKAGTATGE